jgi:hypothetical protein
VSPSVRTFIGVVALVAIVSAWAGIGCMALDKWIGDLPRAQAIVRRAGYALILIACLTFFNATGGLLTLVLLTGTPPDRSEALVLGIPVPMPVLLERIIIGVFAFVLDVGALLAWLAAGAGIVQRLRRKTPPPPP